MLKRRDFVKGTLIGGAAVAAAPAVHAAKKKFRWRLVMAIPKTLPVWADHVQRFADMVSEMSDKALQIKVYGAGELVPALETFSAVKAGRVEMGHAAAYYWQGKIPAAPFFTCVPFGLNTNGMRAWVTAGGGQELWDELYKPHGVMGLLCGNTGLQMGGWFNKEIKSMKDFKGLKMRIPGLGSKVIAKAGGKPVLVAGGEIFTNLSTGVIDATEWVGPYHDYVMGFHKAAKFYYYPGWHEPGPALELMINRKKFAELPKDLQAIVRAAATATDNNMYAEWLVKDAEYFAKIKNEGKVKVLPFPKDVLKQMKTYADQVKAEVAKTSKLAKRIYDSHENFQKSYMGHQRATEWAYDAALED